MPDSHIVKLKVWADYACFTRPELKVERLSYPFMTPSAARGILDAILFKKKTDPATHQLIPAFSWHIRRITALQHPVAGPSASPYQLISIRRNEIQAKIAPRTVSGWIKDPASFTPYLVDSAGRDSADGQNRTQRNTLALRNPAYLIEASIHMDHFSASDPPVKYREMFERRAQKGQYFHHPYMGCREFACDFAPPDGSEIPLASWNEPLGLMLYDLRFPPNAPAIPGFFHATIKSGVLHCDTAFPSPSDEPPIQILGWS